MKATDLAYAAGLIEADGHIGNNQIKVGMTDFQAPEFLYQTFGGKTNIRVTKDHRKDRKEWWVQAEEAQRVASLIYPYLRIDRKRQEALALLEWKRTNRSAEYCKNGHHLPTVGYRRMREGVYTCRQCHRESRRKYKRKKRALQHSQGVATFE